MKKKSRILRLILTTVLLVAAITATVSAASYPLIVYLSTESTTTIPVGETGTLRFMILPEFKNEEYNVEIYNSSGQKVAAASDTYYNASGTVVKYVNIGVDTDKLDLDIGTYTVKYWTRFYSLYQWNSSPKVYTGTFKVIANTCKGNHKLVLDYVVTEGTCEKEGCIKQRCTKCEYVCYVHQYGDHTYGSWSKLNDSTHQRTCTACEKTETASHSWNSGTVTKQPTCAETGIKTYTCSVCSGTKTETVAKTNDHSFGSWTKVSDSLHQRSCTRCQKTETADHSWNSGTVTKQPTCAETGIKTYTCSACSGTKTETVAKTNDHSYGKGTMVDEETHKHNCTLCGKSETVSHTWDSGTVTLMPTYESTGLKDVTCTSCGFARTLTLPVRSLGDINYDLLTDTEDVISLLLHISMPDMFPMDAPADFTGDSKVNTDDAVRLLLHISMPDMFPLTAGK